MIYVLKATVTNDDVADSATVQLFATQKEAQQHMRTAYENNKSLFPHAEIPFSAEDVDYNKEIVRRAIITPEFAEIALIEDGCTTEHLTWEIFTDDRFIPKPSIPKIEIGKEYVFFYGSDDGDSKQLINHNGRKCRVVADSANVLKNKALADRIRTVNGGLFNVQFNEQLSGDSDDSFDVYACELVELDDCVESKHGGFYVRKGDFCNV